MSTTEQYALGLLAEEMGEALQRVGKWLRFGGSHVSVSGENPRQQLSAELGDVLAAIDFVTGADLIDARQMREQAARKLDTLLDRKSVDDRGKPLAPLLPYPDVVHFLGIVSAIRASAPKSKPSKAKPIGADFTFCGTCGANRAEGVEEPPSDLIGKSGGYCPECHAPAYGGPIERRPRDVQAAAASPEAPAPAEAGADTPNSRPLLTAGEPASSGQGPGGDIPAVTGGTSS